MSSAALERGARGLGGAILRVAVRVDPRAVLRPHVVPLPHALRRVVALPEDLQKALVARFLRIEDDEDDFGMPGAAEHTSRYVGSGLDPAAYPTAVV